MKLFDIPLIKERERERGCHIILYIFTLYAIEPGPTNISWKYSKCYTLLWKYNLTQSPSSYRRSKQQATHEGFSLIFLLPHILRPFLQAPPRRNSQTPVEYLLPSARPQPVTPVASCLINTQKELVEFANNLQILSTQQRGRVILFHDLRRENKIIFSLLKIAPFPAKRGKLKMTPTQC